MQTNRQAKYKHKNTSLYNTHTTRYMVQKNKTVKQIFYNHVQSISSYPLKSSRYSSTPPLTTQPLCAGNYSEFDAVLIILVEGEGGREWGGVERGLEDR